MNTRPPKRPNVFTPFLRRFTDERADDLRSTVVLYNRVRSKFANSIWSRPQALDNFATAILTLIRPEAPPALTHQFVDCIRQLLRQEATIFALPDFDPLRSISLQDQVNLRRFLRAKEHFLDHDEAAADVIGNALSHIFCEISTHLPAIDTDSSLQVPLSVLSKDLNGTINHIIGVCAQEKLGELGVGIELCNTVYANLCRISNIKPDDPSPSRSPIFAGDYQGDPLDYLEATPLKALFETSVPWYIPDRVRPDHMLGIAPTGSGKTQFIQQDILQFLSRPDAPGLVVIDSQNQMIPKLERLRCAADKIVIVDPFDEVQPPALNMFIQPQRDYDENLKEVIETETLQQFAWIFSALDQDLSPRMTTMFTFVTRVLLRMAPNANLRTFLDFLNIKQKHELEASQFWRFIQALDEDTQRYFNARYCAPDLNTTKAGVADRLLGVLRVPAFNRMFNAPANRLDLYQLLAERKLVVFNTQKRKLGPDASAVLGRYAIALYIRAAFEREADVDPPLALLYVDEASEYFGKQDRSDTLFTQLRKYKCGTAVFFQEASQMGQQTANLMANTITKLAARVSPNDATMLAAAMRTTAHDLLNTKKEQGVFEMSCYIKDEMSRALHFKFKYGAVENAPKLTDSEYAEMKAANRRLLSVTTNPQPQPAALPRAYEQQLNETSLRDVSSLLPDDDDMTSPGKGGWKK